MKRVGNLFEKVTSFENILLSAKKAWKGKRFKSSVSGFFFNLENEIFELQKELVSGSYKPSGYSQFEIREPKIRKISCSVFRDRVVHHAICNILDLIFERRFICDTYACRNGKGTHRALKKCQTFSQKYSYYLKCDIKKYFESVDHHILKNMLRRMIKDKKLLHLLDLIIDHPMLGVTTGIGLPIGNLTSQYFANLYLSKLDHYLKEELQIKGYLRYMDDFILFDESSKKLWGHLRKIRSFLQKELKLRLKEKVVRVAPVTEGVPFLGCRIFKNTVRLQRFNLVRVRRKIKKKEKAYVKGNLSEKELFQSIQSMMAHMNVANTMKLRRKEWVNTKSLA